LARKSKTRNFGREINSTKRQHISVGKIPERDMNIAKRLFAWPDPIKAALALHTLLALFFVWCAVFGRGSFGFKDILPIAMMMLVSAFYGMALLPVLFGKAELEKAFGSVVSAIG
jgi:hypothetical protein